MLGVGGSGIGLEVRYLGAGALGSLAMFGRWGRGLLVLGYLGVVGSGIGLEVR